MRVAAKVAGQLDAQSENHLTFMNQRIIDGDFSGRRWEWVSAAGSRFEHCKFERMKLKGASTGAGTSVSEYVDCSFDGSRFLRIGGGFTRFIRCSFRDIDIRRWDIADYVELIDCVFSGKIKSVVFWGRPLPDEARSRYESMMRHREKEGLGPPPREYRELVLRGSNEFHGNDFSQVELVDVDFRYGIDLTKQQLPSGPDYLYLADARAVVDEALARAVQVKPEDLRARVVRFLEQVIGGSLKGGQRQTLLREKDFKSKPHIPVAFRLLREVEKT
jgi:hypothetical protein